VKTSDENREVAKLLRERADLMEFFAAGAYEIKLELRYKEAWGGHERHLVHYVTSDDERFEQEDLDTVWSILYKRLSHMDKRLSQLGVRFDESEIIKD